MANQSYATSKVAQSSLNFFVGYKSEEGTLAAEYNTQNGHGNTKGDNWSGLSIYGTLPIIKQLNVFARFDDLSSDKIVVSKTTTTNGVTTTTTTDLPWNSTKTGTDGQVYMVGVEFVPVKGIQIAPNFRYAAPSSDAKTAGAFAVSSINLNLGINF
jgi:hypothetical protein